VCSLKNYKDYIEKVDYYNEKDNRELNYQNRIIIPFLENLFQGEKAISIVDVSTQYKNRNSKHHNREPYANECTPDLLIAKNWHYYNRENVVGYLAVVEIKIPNSKDTSQINKYFKSNEGKVIWTNCLTWRFFVNGEEFLPEVNLKYTNDEWKEDTSDWNALITYIKEFIKN